MDLPEIDVRFIALRNTQRYLWTIAVARRHREIPHQIGDSHA
jgi:hypothetical protein